MIKRITSRDGNPTKVNTSKGMFGLVPGQEIKITTRNVYATVIGVGGWPNEFGRKKLWVEEKDGTFTFIECENDFEPVLYK